jgi:cation-transporting ATPase F
VVAKKGGLLAEDLLRDYPRLDTVPFESEYQFMATRHSHPQRDAHVIYWKGAVERALERCTQVLCDDGTLRAIDPNEVRRIADDMAGRGLRVLAFSSREAPAEPRLDHAHVRSDMIFLGLQGMIDPPRPEAIAAVRACKEAGIKVKMITGDHPLTARAVAEKLGLVGPESREAMTVLAGRDLERIHETELPELSDKTAVFARVAPEQKLRLVRALQGTRPHRGHDRRRRKRRAGPQAGGHRHRHGTVRHRRRQGRRCDAAA